MKSKLRDYGSKGGPHGETRPSSNPTYEVWLAVWVPVSITVVISGMSRIEAVIEVSGLSGAELSETMYIVH